MKYLNGMEISNVRVYGLEESIVASSFPMNDYELKNEEFDCEVNNLKQWINEGSLLEIHKILKDVKIKDITKDDAIKINNKFCENLIDESNFDGMKKALAHLRRGLGLGGCISGEGHDCMLKGITVQYNLKAPEHFWRQHDRYHFSDYISSMSKMHRIIRVKLEDMCNKYVDGKTINMLNDLIKAYNDFENYDSDHDYLLLRSHEKIPFTKENLFKLIVNNIPAGFQLTARMTSNYLQEKSKYLQREHHKMDTWKDVYCPFLKDELPLFYELTGIEKIKKSKQLSIQGKIFEKLKEKYKVESIEELEQLIKIGFKEKKQSE